MTRMCSKCGSRAASRVEVNYHGTTVAVGRLCPSCLEEAVGRAAKLTEQFEELIALGVNRVLANEVMIDRINARSLAAKEASA